MDSYLSDKEIERAKQDALTMPYVQKLLDFYCMKHEDVIYETYLIFCNKLKELNQKMNGLNIATGEKAEERLDTLLKIQKSIPDLIETIESLKKKSDSVTDKEEKGRTLASQMK